MQIDDKVIMPEKRSITPMEDWPVQGSMYECEGTVVNTGVDIGGNPCVDVIWDNGQRLNNIGVKYLKKVKSTEYRKQKKKLKL